MAYISGDSEKKRIAERERGKLQKELKDKYKDAGIQELRGMHNQSEYQKLKDFKNEFNHIKETMQSSGEIKKKQREEERKRKRKPINEQLKLYFQKKEREAQQQYASRRIIFNDGGFNVNESLKMTSCKVLLQEIIEKDKKGIIIPEMYIEKFPKYKVVAKNEDCDKNIKIGDIVLAEAYSGIEVVSKEDKYRIVYDDEIICILKKDK